MTATRIHLTRRELDIVRLVARGLANKEVADKLGLSPATIASRLRLLFAKFGVHKRGALVHQLAPLLPTTAKSPPDGPTLRRPTVRRRLDAA